MASRSQSPSSASGRASAWPSLVSLIAGIVCPQAVSIRVGEEELAEKSDAELRNFRVSKIGFIFQEFELLDYLNVIGNVLLPFYINRSLRLDAGALVAARELAASVGLGGLSDRLPRELSHGERQRVAIARALVTRPEIVIADEPTGNLDPSTTASIMKTILGGVREREATLIMVTHDYSLLDSFDRSIDLAGFVAGRRVASDTTATEITEDTEGDGL